MAIAAACGGGGESGGSTGPTNSNPGGTTNPGGSVTNTVNLADQAFNPGSVTVPAGTTVTWQWPTSTTCSDGYGGYFTCPTHSVTFDDGSNIASPTQSTGTFTRTFSAPGTYKYHCAVHGTAMSGQVIVQ